MNAFHVPLVPGSVHATACASPWNVQRVFWYGWRDPALASTTTDYWGYHAGVVRAVRIGTIPAAAPVAAGPRRTGTSGSRFVCAT